MTDFRTTAEIEVKLTGQDEAARQLDRSLESVDAEVTPTLASGSADRIANQIERRISDIRADVDVNFAVTAGLGEIDRTLATIDDELREIARIELDPLATLDQRADAVVRGGKLREIREDFEDLRQAAAGDVNLTVDTDARTLRAANRELDELIRDGRDVDINLDVNGTGRLRAAQTQMQGFATQAKAAGGAIAAFAALAAVQGVARQLRDAVNAARDLEASGRDLNRVFGESSINAEAFSDDAALSLGLARDEANRYQATLGEVLIQQGLLRNDALETSQAYISLATDIAAANSQISQEQAVSGLAEAIAGDLEALQNLGLAVNEYEIAQQSANIVAASGGTITAEAARQQALYNAIMREGADDQGAFQSAANETDRTLAQAEAQFRNAQAAIGQELLPVVADLATIFAEDLAPAIADLAPLLQGVIAFITPLIEQLATAAQVIGFVADQVERIGDSPAAVGQFAGNLVNPQNFFTGDAPTLDTTNLREYNNELRDTADIARIAAGPLADVNAQVAETELTARAATDEINRTITARRDEEAAIASLAQALRDGTIAETEFAAARAQSNLTTQELIDLIPEAEGLLEQQLQEQVAAAEQAAADLAAARDDYAASILGFINAPVQLDGTPTLREFFQEQQEAVDEQIAFFDNIDFLRLSGADNLANQLTEQFQAGDIEGAAALAAQSANLGFEDLRLAEITAEELDQSQAELIGRANEIAATEIPGEGPISRFIQQDIDRAFQAVNEIDFGDPLTNAFAAADLGSLAGAGGFDTQPLVDELAAAADGLTIGLDFTTPINEAIANTTTDFTPVQSQFDANTVTLQETIGAADFGTPLQGAVDSAGAGLAFGGLEEDLRAGGFSAGQAFGDGMSAGIRSKVGQVTSSATFIANQAEAAIRRALGIASPSRVAFTLGSDTSEGFRLGILSDVRGITRAATTASNAAASALATPGALNGGAAGNTTIIDNSRTQGDVNVVAPEVPATAQPDVWARIYGQSIRRATGGI